MTLALTISAVSYLNTVPFIYGIEHADGLRASLLLSPPNQCVENYKNGKADLALVPVAAIPALADAHIITDYCLGAVRSVRTVVLVSDSPLEKIKTLYTDFHSVTSARLVAVLCRELWNIAPLFAPLDDYGIIETRKEGDAFLLIGDKVFGYEGMMQNSWDLADAWRELTGLPFVFACWIARKGVPEEAIEALNKALAWGVAHIPEAVRASVHAEKPYAEEYLTKNIDYLFDRQKQQALSLFWEKGMKQSLRVNPG